MYEDKVKRLYDDVISSADGIFDQWDPSAVIPMEEVCGPQRDYVEK